MDSTIIVRTPKVNRELVKAIVALPLDEQAHLVSTVMYNVRRMVSAEVPDTDPEEAAQKRAEELLRIAESVMGIKLSDGTKKREVVEGRRMVMYQLYCEGIGPKMIGYVMNRQRDVIQYNINQFENMLHVPKAYKQEMVWWLAFQDKI